MARYLKRTNYILTGGQAKEMVFVATKSNDKTIINFKLNKLSKVDIFVIATGLSPVNVELNVDLIGDNSRAIVSLIGLAAKNNLHNFWINLRHSGQKTYSRINCRRVGFDDSISSCYSKILIEPSASGTDTYLSDQSILLGSACKIQSNPVLEIKHHNVKASHGSATGKISPIELFYLQTRGLTEIEAKTIILQSFLKAVLPDKIYADCNLTKKLKLYVTENSH